MRALARADQAQPITPRSSTRRSHRGTFMVVVTVIITAAIMAAPARATTFGVAGVLGLPGGLTLPTTLSTGCQSGLCVDVDTTRPLEPAAHQASGILHSVGGAGSNEARFAQLGVTMWRSSNNDWTDGPAPWNAAAESHVPVTYVLSDKWVNDFAGTSITPWANWSTYRDWVVSSVRQIANAGIHVDYWEVYNEPDWDLPAPEAGSVTPDKLLTQFLVAYQAIRSVVPDAQIIGPSTSHWLAEPTSRSFSMPQFLSFAASHQLGLAAISWHYMATDPGGIGPEVAEARSLIASNPALGTPKIFINEFGALETQRIAGWDVQYLASLTNARVDAAGRTCWPSDCSSPVFDGLLAADGSSTLPVYWERVSYAEMTGSMVAASTNSTNAGALASLDPTGSQVRVLLGYGRGCFQDPRCLQGSVGPLPGPSLSTTVVVHVPWAAGSVVISESQVPGSVLPISRPQTTNLGTVSIIPQGGAFTVTVNVGTITDGEADALILTHVG